MDVMTLKGGVCVFTIHFFFAATSKDKPSPRCNVAFPLSAGAKKDFEPRIWKTVIIWNQYNNVKHSRKCVLWLSACFITHWKKTLAAHDRVLFWRCSWFFCYITVYRDRISPRIFSICDGRCCCHSNRCVFDYKRQRAVSSPISHPLRSPTHTPLRFPLLGLHRIFPCQLYLLSSSVLMLWQMHRAVYTCKHICTPPV